MAINPATDAFLPQGNAELPYIFDYDPTLQRRLNILPQNHALTFVSNSWNPLTQWPNFVNSLVDFTGAFTSPPEHPIMRARPGTAHALNLGDEDAPIRTNFGADLFVKTWTDDIEQRNLVHTQTLMVARAAREQRNALNSANQTLEADLATARKAADEAKAALAEAEEKEKQRQAAAAGEAGPKVGPASGAGSGAEAGAGAGAEAGARTGAGAGTGTAAPAPAPAPGSQLLTPLAIPMGNRLDDLANADAAIHWADIRFRTFDSWTLSRAPISTNTVIQTMYSSASFNRTSQGRHFSAVAVNAMAHGGDIFHDSRLVEHADILKTRYDDETYAIFRRVYEESYGNIKAGHDSAAVLSVLSRARFSSTAHPMPCADIIKEHENFINQYVSNHSFYGERITGLKTAPKTSYSAKQMSHLFNLLAAPEKHFRAYMREFAQICHVVDVLAVAQDNHTTLTQRLTVLARFREGVYKTCNHSWQRPAWCHERLLFMNRWPNNTVTLNHYMYTPPGHVPGVPPLPYHWKSSEYLTTDYEHKIP